jgi:hypothetical protein
VRILINRAVKCFMNIGRAGARIYDKIIFIFELHAIDIENNRGPSIDMTLSSTFTEATANSDVDDACSARDSDLARVNSQLLGEMQTQTFNCPGIRNALAALVTKLIWLVVALRSEEGCLN